MVVVPDCGGRVPREAGLRLFNRWGIGSRGRDDGVLLLVTLSERRCEFLLGDGLDDDANVLRSQAIVDREMLPRLRRGDLGGAVAAGAEAAARELFAGPAAPAASVADVEVERVTGSVPSQPEQDRPVAVVATPAPRLAVQPDISYAQPMNDADRLTWLFGGGLTALAGGFGTMIWLRRRPRTCPSCRVPMVKLDEQADNAHLTSSQCAEESVGSVDYDVWACPTCPHVVISRHGALFTRFHSCQACGARTASDRSTVLEAATEFSNGSERIDTRCSHCGNHEVCHRTVPRLQRHSRSGSSGSSFRSMGGSSGGGRSSGRGGGGGW